MERRQAEDLATTAGLTVRSGASRKLDILVCADPHSRPGTARMTRDRGVRIMAEEAFWRALGV
jgi:hypothetical protein